MLDTDVLLSGLRSATGASRLLLHGVNQRAFTPLTTVPMLIEHEEVLTRADNLLATGLSRSETDEFLDGLLLHAERVQTPIRYRPSIQDPDDEMFVEALLNGAGDAIVTFNRRDYLDADHRLASLGRTAVPVITPGDVLRSSAWQPPAITPFVFPPR